MLIVHLQYLLLHFHADNLEKQGYYSQMKGVVEQMFEQNNQTKVTLVVHSMGGPVSLNFLNNIVDQTWKDKYIHAYVPLSAAWDGAAVGVQVLVSGLQLEHDGFIPNLLSMITRTLVRTFQSVYWLLPSPEIWGNQVIVTVGSANYTASDFENLFDDASISNGYMKYSNAKGINSNWPAPNVPTHCFYGLLPVNNTWEAFTYSPEGFPDEDPVTVLMGAGDGVVNARVSEICKRWWNQTANFTVKTFEVNHTAMATDMNVLAAIGEIVGAPVNVTSSPGGGVCPTNCATVIAGMIILALLMI